MSTSTPTSRKASQSGELYMVPVPAQEDESGGYSAPQTPTARVGVIDPVPLNDGNHQNTSEPSAAEQGCPTPYLITPFQLSEWDWESQSLEVHPLTQEFWDSHTAAEYRRFAHRDLAIGLIISMYVVGCIIYPASGIVSVIQVDWINYACAVGFALLFPTELLLHWRWTNTAKIALFRRIIQFVIGVLSSFATTFLPFTGYYLACETNLFPLKELRILDPDLTANRVQWYCRSIINPFTIVTVTNTLCAIPLPPLMVVAIIMVELSCELAARFVLPDQYAMHPESGREIATKVLVAISTVSFTFTFMFLRHRAMMGQFSDAVALSIETTRSKKREEEVDTLLCAMLPTSALLRISMNQPVSDWSEEATVLFSDMVQFTAWSSTRSPADVVEMLNRVCISIDQIATQRRVEKVKTIGDAYWAVCGLPEAVADHAERICDFGNAMLDCVKDLNHRHPEWGWIQLRVGVHTGPLGGGILGTQQLSYEVFGVTSKVAEEVEKAGRPSRVAISHTTLAALDLADGALGEPYQLLMDEGVEYRLFLLGREGAVRQTHNPKHGSMRRTRRPTTDGSSTPSNSAPQSANSSRSRDSMRKATALDAKKRRQEFLEKRAAAANELAQEGDGSKVEVHLTLEAIEEKYSKRRWNWVLQTYADEEVEAQFYAFAVSRSWNLRLATRIASLLSIVITLICIGIESGSFSTASIVLFTFALASAVTDVGLCWATTPWFVPVGVHHLTEILFLLAAGLMPEGASSATNDITYLHGICTMFLAFGNAGPVSTALILVLNLGIILPLMVGFIVHTVMFFVSLVFLLQADIIVLISATIIEKQLRRQFLDRRIALHMKDEQVRKNLEQHALLKSIVPDHVVDELMVWLTEGMDLRRSVVKRFEVLSVAFVHLSPPDDATGTGGAMTNPLNLLGLPAAPVLPEPPSQTSVATDGVTETEDDEAWLATAHAAVDGILSRFPAVTKIKTIGDIVMLAGSFVNTYSQREAAFQMVCALWHLRAEVSPHLQAGLHTGEIVGGVLGTNRLCFDIFGDTVNVASRSMTGGSTGDVLVTTDFLSCLQHYTIDDDQVLVTIDHKQSEHDQGGEDSSSPTFGPLRHVAAKGKGELSVRPLLKAPLQFIPA